MISSTQKYALDICMLLVALVVFLPEQSYPQNFETRGDAISGVGGKSNSANIEAFMSGGQLAPIGISQSTNFDLSAGFIYVIPRTPSGNVIAEVICPTNFAQGCSVTSQIKVDMTGMSPPDSVLAAFTGSITWDPSLLQFTGHSGILSGFVGVVNTTNAANGIIAFNGSHPQGVGGLIDILNLDFDVIGTLGSNGTLHLNFTMLQSTIFTDLLSVLTINDCAFNVVKPNLLGDVDGDDQVNSTDALIILSFDVGLPIPPQFQNRINAGVGDVDSDTQTNSTDALIILSFDAGITIPFPVGDPICP
jgi:hypothetical protein